MLIVAGEFQVESQDREAFLAGRVDMIRTSRAEPGCIEYTFAADPIESGRVVLYERWESQDALDAHLKAQRSGPPPAGPQVAVKSMSIRVYDISGDRPLG